MRNTEPPVSFLRSADAEDRRHPTKAAARASTEPAYRSRFGPRGFSRLRGDAHRPAWKRLRAAHLDEDTTTARQIYRHDIRVGVGVEPAADQDGPPISAEDQRGVPVGRGRRGREPYRSARAVRVPELQAVMEEHADLGRTGSPGRDEDVLVAWCAGFYSALV